MSTYENICYYVRYCWDGLMSGASKTFNAVKVTIKEIKATLKLGFTNVTNNYHTTVIIHDKHNIGATVSQVLREIQAVR